MSTYFQGRDENLLSNTKEMDWFRSRCASGNSILKVGTLGMTHPNLNLQDLNTVALNRPWFTLIELIQKLYVLYDVVY